MGKSVLLLFAYLILINVSIATGQVWDLADDWSIIANPHDINGATWDYQYRTPTHADPLITYGGYRLNNRAPGGGGVHTDLPPNHAWTPTGAESYISLCKFTQDAGPTDETVFKTDEIGGHSITGATWTTLTGGTFRIDFSGYNARRVSASPLRIQVLRLIEPDGTMQTWEIHPNTHKGSENALEKSATFTMNPGQQVTVEIIPHGADGDWVGMTMTVTDLGEEEPQAENPNPYDGAINVPPGMVLSWSPGIGAISHDVYFGTDFNSVDAAQDPNILPGRGNQAGTSFDPPGELEFATTYFWRIDEVTASGTYKGEVWRFTTRAENVDDIWIWDLADDWSASENPLTLGGGTWTYHSDGVTYGGSLLNNRIDQLPANTAWTPTGAQSAVSLCRFTEDGNLTGDPEGLKTCFRAGEIGGHSTTGATWTSLTGGTFRIDFSGFQARVPEAAAPEERQRRQGLAYTDQHGVTEVYVINPGLNTSSDNALHVSKTVTLSAGQSVTVEIRVPAGKMGDWVGMDFTVTKLDPNLAHNPIPPDGAVNVTQDVVLNWSPGTYATEHIVYFSEDFNDVNDRVQDANQGRWADAEFDTTELDFQLELSKDYYWRIDEVNDGLAPFIWPGKVWRFTTKSDITLPAAWIEGDINRDGCVDIEDLANLFKEWLSIDCSLPNWCLGVDIDTSSNVDLNDFALVGSNWQNCLEFFRSLGYVVVSPQGPTDGGDFGPDTPATTTSGLQEAFDYGSQSGKDVYIVGHGFVFHDYGPLVYTVETPLYVPAAENWRIIGGDYVMNFTYSYGDFLVFDSQKNCEFKFGLLVAHAAPDGSAVMKVRPKTARPDGLVGVSNSSFLINAHVGGGSSWGEGVIGRGTALHLDGSLGPIENNHFITMEINACDTGFLLEQGDINNNLFECPFDHITNNMLVVNTGTKNRFNVLFDPGGVGGTVIGANLNGGQENIYTLVYDGAGYSTGLIFGNGARDNLVYAMDLPNIVNNALEATNRVVPLSPVGFNIGTPTFPSSGAYLENRTSYTVVATIKSSGDVSSWELRDSNGNGQTIEATLHTGQSIYLEPGDQVLFNYSTTTPDWSWRVLR